MKNKRYNKGVGVGGFFSYKVIAGDGVFSGVNTLRVRAMSLDKGKIADERDRDMKANNGICK